MIKTKVVCTLGPAVDDPNIMKELIAAGMDVARMNFSHGSHQEHLGRLKQFRRLCGEVGAHIPVLLDTKGPEVRLGDFESDEVHIEYGQDFTLTIADVAGNKERASVSYKGLANDVSSGDFILIDDGLVKLQVKSVTSSDIECRALNSGVISSKKSINVPGVALHLPSLTEHDKEDVLFAIEHDYDFIAVSFVRSQRDISQIEMLLCENGGEGIKLIAKIESQQGVDNLDEIIRVSDGIMVARGDLGVELPMEKLPVVQKDMIQRCYRAGKPVITATQMLDSMIRNPRPTRAEVTDVANAIYDGTSAIMLSGETASGKYPVESLKTMKRIAQTTEESIDYWERFNMMKSSGNSSITNAISHATCTTAMDLHASAIVAVTTGGGTARRISSFRPDCPIIAATTSKKVFYQLSMSWGVFPLLVDVVNSTDDLFAVALESAEKSGLVKDGDLIVVTAGVPVGISGTTNMLKVEMIGNVLLRGKGLGNKKATGPVQLIKRDGGKNLQIAKGSILVVDEITDEVLPIMRMSGAIILDGEDKNGRVETLSKVLEIPIIVNAFGATKLLRTGTIVSVDAGKGIVKCVDR